MSVARSGVVKKTLKALKIGCGRSLDLLFFQQRSTVNLVITDRQPVG